MKIWSQLPKRLCCRLHLRIHKLGVSGDKEKLAIDYPEAPSKVRELHNPDLDAPDDFIDVEVVEE
jgi:DNA recombination protein RmuC